MSSEYFVANSPSSTGRISEITNRPSVVLEYVQQSAKKYKLVFLGDPSGKCHHNHEPTYMRIYPPIHVFDSWKDIYHFSVYVRLLWCQLSGILNKEIIIVGGPWQLYDETTDAQLCRQPLESISCQRQCIWKTGQLGSSCGIQRARNALGPSFRYI